MMEINYELTSMLARKRLNDLTGLIKSNLISVETKQLSEIDKSTNLADLVTFNLPLKSEESVRNDLEIISRLDLNSKCILYCVHCLGIARRNLENCYATNDFVFGRPYELYKKAVLKFGLANEELIIYTD